MMLPDHQRNRNDFFDTEENLEGPSSSKYPVLTLPNEIVSEIFVRYLPPEPVGTPWVGDLSPTLLGQICRQWRAIAFATPQLWSTLVFVYRDAKRIPPDAQRSGGYPLTIFINDYYGQLNLSGIISAIVPHCARWEDVTFVVPAPFIDTVGGAMPMLRSLGLTLPSPPVITAVPIPSTAFFSTNVPELRILHINYVPLLLFELPWAQLSSLTMRTVEPEQCCAVLQQMPQLVHCSLTLWTMELEVYEGSEIKLPCLESLVLICYKVPPVLAFLTSFFVPALRKLEISELLLGDSPIASLESFIKKSSCKLQELVITERQFLAGAPWEAYEAAFSSIPRLSKVFAEDSDEDDYESESGSDLDFETGSGSESEWDSEGVSESSSDY
ncbi:F-box domain-containing protein [Favolaschia claudopus]|uniref:F-box domain-containing protein n=1 Tax=Favolaschia claudopus TaxID=2862362 RepID=A0AAW0B1V2_9AGAR